MPRKVSDLTLRQLYYQMVARGYIENSARSYKNFGNIDRRRPGGWPDRLSRIDRTRNLRQNRHRGRSSRHHAFRGCQFPIDKWERQPHRGKFGLRKMRFVGVIDGVCRDLTCCILPAVATRHNLKCGSGAQVDALA